MTDTVITNSNENWIERYSRLRAENAVRMALAQVCNIANRSENDWCREAMICAAREAMIVKNIV